MIKINLMKGDCLDRMKEIPDKSVDMVLTDPPYGTTACKWDSVIPFDLMWKELKRVAKTACPIVMTASQPFTSALVMSNPAGFKHSWVWHKISAGNVLTAKYGPLKTTEDVLVFTPKGEKARYFPVLSYGHKDRSEDNPQPKKTDLFSGVKSGMFKPGNNKPGDARYPKHLIEFSNASRVGVVHPTQKPVALLEYLIKTYTLEGETVLDFTAGSFSTGVACVNLRRSFIGIERDDKYFSIGKKRVMDTICQHLEIEQMSDTEDSLLLSIPGRMVAGSTYGGANAIAATQKSSSRTICPVANQEAVDA